MQSKEELFKERFAIVMDEARAAQADPAQMRLIGSLAGRLVDAARQPGWAAFKASMTRQDYDGLLKSFQEQGNALAQQGAMDQTHVIEILACSMIARTQVRDAAILADDVALNRIIDNAIQRHRAGPAAEPIVS